MKLNNYMKQFKCLLMMVGSPVFDILSPMRVFGHGKPIIGCSVGCLQLLCAV